MRARSPKRAAEMVQRRRLVADVLERRPWCEARIPDVCEGRATEVDEIVGRGVGGDFLDESNTNALCSACHRWKTARPREAQRLGLTRQVRQCSLTADSCVDDSPCISCPWMAA